MKFTKQLKRFSVYFNDQFFFQYNIMFGTVIGTQSPKALTGDKKQDDRTNPSDNWSIKRARH